MKALSEQLDDLAGHAKHAEAVAAVVREKNRAALATQREQLHSKMAETQVKVTTATSAAADNAQAWWKQVRADIDGRLEDIRAKRDEHHAERDIRRAEGRAEDAELDAAEAVDFAEWAMDQAEYAVIDAVLARAEADDVAAAGTGTSKGQS